MNGNSRILIKKGTLWKDIVKSTQRALRIGAQLPIPTEYEFVEERGIRFFVRILSRLKEKDKARKKQQEAYSSSGKAINPFLPYDENMFVTDISDTHVALLNKFNVVEHHLLIVTRYFEDQEILLTLHDFEALWACMSEYNGFGFYNGGEEAGASQRHKHLQMVPLPLAPEGPEVPIEPLIHKAQFKDKFGVIPDLPFSHVLARFKDNITVSPYDAARKTFELYSSMLEKLGLDSPCLDILKKQSKPYCLLVTRQWILLVPRSREFFDSISINSLSFAGALLVRDSEQMDLLKKKGPMLVLQSVALPLNQKNTGFYL
jgi:ATP adenylyltransferase